MHSKMLARSFTSSLSRQAVRVPATGAARLAPRATIAPVRGYASSPPGSDGPGSWPPLPAGFEKLAHNPTAMESIRNLVEVMKKNGLDITSGEKPSMMQLMKLAANSEIREASGKVMKELKDAGINVSPEAMQKIMEAPGDFFKGPKK